MMMTIMADDGVRVRGHEFSYDRGSADRYMYVALDYSITIRLCTM